MSVSAEQATAGNRTLPNRLRASVAKGWRGVALQVGFVGLVLAVFLALGVFGLYNLGFIVDRIGKGLPYANLSLALTVSSFFLGFVFALPIGLVRAYGPGRLRRKRGTVVDELSYKRAKELYGAGKAIRVVGARKVRKALLAPAYGLATGYVEAIRGTPFLVQTFIVYYAIIFAAPRLNILGIDVSIWAGLIALTMNTTGYQAEVMRGGFQSVGQGQIEAARAMGLKARQIFAHITLPQSLRLMILPLTNEWIALFKASTILSYITVVELYFWARQIALAGQPIEGFIMLTVYYLVVNVTLSRAITTIEQRKRIPGLGTQGPAQTRPRPMFARTRT